MIEGERVVRQAASFSLQFVLDDENWRLVGYARRPRRGSFFSRFLPRQRLERETRILQEFLCLTLAAISGWVTHRELQPSQPEALLAPILEICLDGVGRGLWATFRFPSREDAIRYVSGTSEYAAAGPPREMANVFYQRMLPLLAETEKPRWLAYSVNLCWVNSVLAVAPLAMNRAVGDGLIVVNVRTDEDVYLRVAKAVIQSVGTQDERRQ
jgi:hypothetical protein